MTNGKRGHVLAGVRHTGRDREPPFERDAETLRFALRGFEIALPAHESIGALPHRFGLLRQIRIVRIDVAVAQEHEERSREEFAQVVVAYVEAVHAEGKALFARRHRVRTGVRATARSMDSSQWNVARRCTSCEPAE